MNETELIPEKQMRYFDDILFEEFENVCLSNDNQWMTRKELAGAMNMTAGQIYYAIKQLLKKFPDLIETIKPHKRYLYRIKKQNK